MEDPVSRQFSAPGGVSRAVAPDRVRAAGGALDVRRLLEPAALRKAGECMHGLIAALYPICRSITGNGVRETLRRVGEHIPLAIHEVPTGTPAFDWTVPKEWNIREA